MANARGRARPGQKTRRSVTLTELSHALVRVDEGRLADSQTDGI